LQEPIGFYLFQKFIQNSPYDLMKLAFLDEVNSCVLRTCIPPRLLLSPPPPPPPPPVRPSSSVRHQVHKLKMSLLDDTKLEKAKRFVPCISSAC
jgi:hypothetical protein